MKNSRRLRDFPQVFAANADDSDAERAPIACRRSYHPRPNAVPTASIGKELSRWLRQRLPCYPRAHWQDDYFIGLFGQRQRRADDIAPER